MKKGLSFIVTLALLLCLPGLVALTLQASRLLTKASGVPAAIDVDTTNTLGLMPYSFRALGQGGEESGRWLQPVIPQVKALHPRYIRIDHLYDFYHIVNRTSGQLSFDFSKIDGVVNDILATGALPFFSLSYMPDVLSSDGTIIGTPKQWQEWQQVVAQTIAHYSGKSNRNLAGVYYEVWNEPDLFGKFSIGGKNDYTLLYKYAAVGASQVQANANPFFFGGPAIAVPYPNWLGGFLTFVEKNGIRLDFLSWHRYSPRPSVYEEDIVLVDKIIADHPGLSYLQKVITEWGPDSEVAPINDSEQAAAFTIATIRRVMDKVTFLFTFEVKDGLNQTGESLWGRWGILTHENVGVKAKPRYNALKIVDKLQGDRLLVRGEGTHVEAIAAKKNDGTIQILLVNYDEQGEHTEAVPVTLSHLLPGTYEYKDEDLNGLIGSSNEEISTDQVQKTILMTPNSVRLLEFHPISVATVSQIEENLPPIPTSTIITPTVVLSPNAPLVFKLSDTNAGQGSIAFTLQPLWDGSSPQERLLFQIPLPHQFGQKRELAARTMWVGFAPKIVYGIFKDGKPYQTVSSSITSWKADEIHTLSFSWSSSELILVVDDMVKGRLAEVIDSFGAEQLLLEHKEGTIHNLKINGKERDTF